MKYLKLFEEHNSNIETINGIDYINENSNGEKIANDSVSLVNFYKWFGNSKVVDDYNRPIVCYHASKDKFDTFNMGNPYGLKMGRGIYFTTEKEFVNRLLHKNNPRGYKVLYECYLRIEEPIILNIPFSTFDKDIPNDGIISAYGQGYGEDEIKVVNHNQIKSPDNIGLWSTENNNIYK